MSTTSLKLTEALRQRVLVEAERKNISPHAFMVGAIEQAALAAEHRAAFIAEAKAAKEDMMRSGQGFDADEVHAYIAARIAGEDPPRPKARNWRG
jgi:predicted transcriptional regulator